MAENLNEALVECVKACGGSKVVGVKLFPEKGVEPAQRYLLNCLNDDRAEKLGPDHVLLILRMARERGCHAGMEYLCESLSYAPPQPVEPRDEADELRRQVLEMGRQLQHALQRIEHLDRPSLRSAA